MTTEIDLTSYTTIIVAFSGGKDSLACLLHLLDLGVDPQRIELWHHDVDGQEREGPGLMDWPCTPAYCAAVARELDIKLYMSWKRGGFLREMLRDGAPTAPIAFGTPDGIRETGGQGPPNTRRLFPQVSASLTTRWCSSYLKIDVCAAALRNQPRFAAPGARTLVVTGERAAESSSRAKYPTFEPHRADLRRGQKTQRHIDHWRPVHAWLEEEVWEIIERHRINPHPAYRLGWGRVSCAACIFGSVNQWASLRAVNPSQFERIAELEAEFGKTIKRKLSVVEAADKGEPYAMAERDKRAALSESFDEPIRLAEWQLPSGAYGECAGPS